MKKIGFVLLILLACLGMINGQTNRSDTLFTINNQAYSTEDFLKLYKSKKLQGEDLTPLSPKVALNTYIDFQLKVLEAKNLGLDTLSAFRSEFAKYRKQVLDPYLHPVKLSEEKIREAYERSKYFLRAQHILIKLKSNASPEDTLRAYNKAQQIRQRLIKGENFGKLARQYSDDLSVRRNKGNLGYFTVFDMIYPFETAAYQLQVDEISQPVRTRFGYHLIQLLDRKENPGKIKVAHIMIAFPKKATVEQKQLARQKIDSIYSLLQKGVDFSELARKFSDDKKSAQQGGKIPAFGPFQMIREFEEAAFALPSNGAISQPLQTAYGWHIIKRLELISIGSYEKNRSLLVKQIKKDGRCAIPDEQLIAELKQKYNFRENRKYISNFYSILDYAYADLSSPLFHLADSSYGQEQFAQYLSEQPSKNMNEDFKEYINRIYDNFVNSSILAFQKKQLEQSHPEIRELLEEYYNGILVFNLTDKKVWTPSVKDNIGLNKFFEERKNHYEETHGPDVSLDKIRGIVSSDYQNYLEKLWMEELHSKYKIEINDHSFEKIQKDYHD